MSEDEIDEAVHLAMTVGASRTLMLANAQRAAMEASGDAAPPSENGPEATEGFRASAVVESSGDG